MNVARAQRRRRRREKSGEERKVAAGEKRGDEKRARGANGGINHGFIRTRSPEIARLQYYTPRTGVWWE